MRVRVKGRRSRFFSGGRVFLARCFDGWGLKYTWAACRVHACNIYYYCAAARCECSWDYCGECSELSRH